MAVSQLTNNGGLAGTDQSAATQIQDYVNSQGIAQMQSAADAQVGEKWIAVADQAIQNMPTA